jgi:hypothetical protein
MLIHGALWGLLGGVLVIALITITTLAKLCEGDWRLFVGVLGDMFADKTSSLWRTLGVILLSFAVMGTGIAAYNMGGVPRVAMQAGLVMYVVAVAIFYLGIAVLNAGWKGYKAWPAVWRTMHRHGTPQRKRRNTIVHRLFFAAMALSAIYAYLGFYDSLV